MVKIMKKFLYLISSVVVAGCGQSGSDVYTLYRNSPVDPQMRIHVSTYDAKDGNEYNNENCQIGQKVFQNQPGVTVKYWC
jgi:lysine/ornithine N-monooxygenase